MVQCVDSIHKAVMGPPDNDNDSVVGADSCEGEWGQHHAGTTFTERRWLSIV